MSSVVSSGKYSAGIKSGTVLMPEFQYDRLHAQYKEDFEPVYINSSLRMYRYKHANTVIAHDYTFNASKLDDAQDAEFRALVGLFMDVLTENSYVKMIEADEDEDYTYGAMCTAIATLRYYEMDWLLEKEFGSFYTLRHVSTLEEEGEE